MIARHFWVGLALLLLLWCVCVYMDIDISLSTAHMPLYSPIYHCHCRSRGGSLMEKTGGGVSFCDCVKQKALLP